MPCCCNPQQAPLCTYFGVYTTNFIYFLFDKYKPFCSPEWMIPNPIPENSILVSFSVKFNAWKMGKMKISTKLNGTLTSSTIDDQSALPCWGTTECGCVPFYLDLPHNDYAILIPCLEIKTKPSIFTNGIPNYNYGAENNFSFCIDMVHPQDECAIDTFEFSSVDLIFRYVKYPAVEYIKGMNTQDIWDYREKALEYEFNEKPDYVFYYGNYIPSQDGSSPTYIEYYKEPVVAIAGEQFSLEVHLYNEEYDPSLKVDCLWSISNGGGKGMIKDITSHPFTIPMVAPDKLDNSRSIKLTLKYKYVNPDDGSVKSLGTQIIDDIPLYTIFDFSKKLDKSNTLPSKELLKQALNYAKGTKTSMNALNNLIKGIFDDPCHQYNYKKEPYFPAVVDACMLAEFFVL